MTKTMTTSDRLFVSRLSFTVLATVLVLISYAIFTTYSTEIQHEVARVLNDSFGHIKGELAQL